MKNFRCQYCDSTLNLGEIAVSSASGKLFCDTKHSPLEEEGCARKYAERERTSESYFYIKIEDKK